MDLEDERPIKDLPLSPLRKFGNFFKNVIYRPAVWFRETIVEPNRAEYYWYHERLRRVPTIDECYEDDLVCQYEANQQYLLDRQVDQNIIDILSYRYKNCIFHNEYDKSLCDDLKNYLENAKTNFFIKYGDMSYVAKALECYMKQKHRMAWERRHGPVGSGKRSQEESLP